MINHVLDLERVSESWIRPSLSRVQDTLEEAAALMKVYHKQAMTVIQTSSTQNVETMTGKSQHAHPT